MEKIEILKNGTTKNFNVSKTVLQYINTLKKELEKMEQEKTEQKERQNRKFKNFSELVFSKIINTEKIGKTCKQINFENGASIRYHSKNCDNFRLIEK